MEVIDHREPSDLQLGRMDRCHTEHGKYCITARQLYSKTHVFRQANHRILGAVLKEMRAPLALIRTDQTKCLIICAA